MRALIAKLTTLDTPSPFLQAGNFLCASGLMVSQRSYSLATRDASLKVCTLRFTYHHPSRTYRMFFWKHGASEYFRLCSRSAGQVEVPREPILALWYDATTLLINQVL